MATTESTLVLGGGGVTGIAWELGVLAGLADAGVRLHESGPILGTSAGSTVAAQITSGASLDELFDRQLAGVPYEIAKSMGAGAIAQFLLAQLLPGSPEQVGRRVGTLALGASTGSLAERRGVIEARLPVHDWPDADADADLGLVVMNTRTGRHRVITRADGIGLVEAVAASCAVPLIWPCVSLQGEVFMDGGIRSPLNLDLAPGSGCVLALAPTSIAFSTATKIPAQIAALAPRPVCVITPDAATRAARGRNALDSAMVPAVARAGRAQGLAEAPRVAALLEAQRAG